MNRPPWMIRARNAWQSYRVWRHDMFTLDCNARTRRALHDIARKDH